MKFVSLFVLSIVVALSAAQSCSLRENAEHIPFKDVDCAVNSRFELYCSVELINSDEDGNEIFTEKSNVKADWHYPKQPDDMPQAAGPQIVDVPKTPRGGNVTLKFAAELPRANRNPLSCVPEHVTFKLRHTKDDKKYVYNFHTWAGSFREVALSNGQKYAKKPKVAVVVGPEGSGKSSLINNLIHMHYRYRPRRFIEYAKVNDGKSESRHGVTFFNIDNPTGKFNREPQYNTILVDTPGIPADASRDKIVALIHRYMKGMYQEGYIPGVKKGEGEQGKEADLIIFVTPVPEKPNPESDLILKVINNLAQPLDIPILSVATKLDLFNATAVPNCVDYSVVDTLIKKSGLNSRLAPWIFTHNVGREDATVLAEPTPESLGFEAANYNVIAQMCSSLYFYADEEAASEYLRELEEKKKQEQDKKVESSAEHAKMEL